MNISGRMVFSFNSYNLLNTRMLHIRNTRYMNEAYNERA